MARSKRPASNKRRSTRRKPSGQSAGTLRRFIKALSTSAVVSFSIASCVLNPQWQEQTLLEPILAEWGWPGHEPLPPLVASQGPTAHTKFGQCTQFFPRAQTPIVPAAPSLRELCFSSFAILHNGATKTPVFVAQRLNRHMLQQARSIERTDRFYAEARLPSAERAELSDYRGSGYSRGHMAPAGDMHNDEAMAQSFSLANMVPQNQVQNAGAWSQIEQDTRKYIMRARGDVYIFTGPVYGEQPGTIGEGRVAIPTYLYKVVHDVTTGRSWVHWQANRSDAVALPPISYEEFVRRTALQLLP